ncbi:MAG: prolyl oligopeptidase family serine peptidase [Planctomycetota bacterium]
MSRKAAVLVPWVLLGVVGLVPGGCGAGPESGGGAARRGTPPETARGEVVDDYHGTRIADPYRWLEDQDGAEVLAWADRQNEFTERHLGEVADRAELRTRLAELWNFPRWSAPTRHGKWWSWSANEGLRNQSMLMIGESPDGEGDVLLDPNALSADGTVAVVGTSFSNDGSRLAYALSSAGSDWREWRVLDVASRESLADRVPWSKFCTAAWLKDGSGFFYQRFPAPSEGQEFEAETRHAQLCLHRIGEPVDSDRVVYERPDQPDWMFDTTVTDDGRFAFVEISAGSDRRARIAWIDLSEPELAVRPLLMDFDAAWQFVEMVGDEALFLSDADAPRGRLLRVSLDAEARRTEVVGQRAERMQSARIVGGEILLRVMRDAHDVLLRFAPDGAFVSEVALPEIGTISTITGAPSEKVAHFTFESFTRPASVFALDTESGKLRTIRTPKLSFDPAEFETRQVRFQSADGTPLQMFVVRRRGELRLDGLNPTVLYGYGGFDISIGPSFSVEQMVFLERGGIFAVATLRGGGEFGEEWHAAGMRERKQNVFDDFLAAARYLHRNGYADAKHLAIEGGSNGGLLVGACLVQQPALFGAAIPQVGVLDMLRYHLFTIGWAWASEYGTSAEPDMFPVLLAYSPLHNVRAARYPPTLVMTGDHDDRVLPGHSYKFAAALQSAQRGDAPILLRVSRRAGHGAGKPTSMRIEEAADRLAFLTMTIGRR